VLLLALKRIKTALVLIAYNVHFKHPFLPPFGPERKKHLCEPVNKRLPEHRNKMKQNKLHIY
jgi:hypothetical protein